MHYDHNDEASNKAFDPFSDELPPSSSHRMGAAARHPARGQRLLQVPPTSSPSTHLSSPVSAMRSLAPFSPFLFPRADDNVSGAGSLLPGKTDSGRVQAGAQTTKLLEEGHGMDSVTMGSRAAERDIDSYFESLPTGGCTSADCISPGGGRTEQRVMKARLPVCVGCLVSDV